MIKLSSTTTTAAQASRIDLASIEWLPRSAGSAAPTGADALLCADNEVIRGVLDTAFRMYAKFGPESAEREAARRLRLAAADAEFGDSDCAAEVVLWHWIGAVLRLLHTEHEC